MAIPMRGLLLALIITALSSGAAAAASLLVPSSVDMAIGAAMPAPSGHSAFCETRRSECAPMQDHGPIAMNPSRWRSVWAINRGVNAAIRGRTDMEIFGREEVWTYPEAEGDCEDFALLKRRMLIEAGFSASNLLMTTVRLEDGSGHAVLTLRTADGDYILDNLVNTVKPWRDTPYDYVRRQSSTDAGLWLSIENGIQKPVLVATAKPQ
jgi:predicted transglutaminase-like cysteine proteinase